MGERKSRGDQQTSKRLPALRRVSTTQVTLPERVRLLSGGNKFGFSLYNMLCKGMIESLS